MKPQWYYCYLFFFFFFLREVFLLGFRGTSCQAGDVSVIEASAADEFEYYCINASFVCRRTQKVRPDGLITLHIPVLTAHRLACCKHPSNLHYHLECVFFFFFYTLSESEQNPPRWTCSATRTQRERERERKSRVFISSIIMTDMILLPVVLFVITWTTTL